MGRERDEFQCHWQTPWVTVLVKEHKAGIDNLEN